jgi:regulator of protease activity HflC (stomatin/prohibitin superfamily)
MTYSLGKIVGAVIAIVTVITLIVLLIAFRGYSVPSDMVAIRVGAGPFEASKIKGDCIQPSTRGYLTNDDYQYFPTSEREWDATGQKGSDGDRFKSVTQDNVEMSVPVTVRFTLITECDTLKDFYIRYARRYNVEFKNDGSYNDEWITLLRKLVADPADATLDRIIQDYTWRKVWNDPATKVEIEKRFNDALASDTSLMVQTAKGAFFDGISVLVGKPEPTNPDLAKAVAQEQTNVAQAQAAEAQAKADKARAEAETAVAIAEAAKQQAVIAGYGGPENFLMHECIAAGCNPYQPSYGAALTTPKGN